MRFMIIPRPGPGAAKTDGTFDEKVFTAYMKFNEDLTKAGVLITSEGLNPAGSSARLALSGGRRTLTDGPFAESKELIAGFYLIEVKTKEDAIAWAARCPIGHGGDEILDLYQMTELSDLPPRLQEIIGKVAPTWSSKLWRSI